MRSTYGAYLAGWANVNSGQISADPANYGAASWQFQSEKGATELSYGFIGILDGWWSFSGESALGFWGAMHTAAVNIVDDPAIGDYAYGALLESTADGAYSISPRDGLAQRINVMPAGKLGIELEGARYTQAQIARDGSRISMTLAPVADGEYEPVVTLRNLANGTYTVAGSDDPVVVEDGTATIEPGTMEGEQLLTLQLADEPTQPTDPTDPAGPGTPSNPGSPDAPKAGAGGVEKTAASGSDARRLSTTGTDAGLLLALGLASVLAGTAAVIRVRRRRRAERSL